MEIERTKLLKANQSLGKGQFAGKNLLLDSLEPLKTLATADPSLAREVIRLLKKNNLPISNHDLQQLLEDTLWGMNHEVSFGYAIAKGFGRLLGQGCCQKVSVYRHLVYQYGETGPTLGRLIAEHLPPVLIHGKDRLLENFVSTIETMVNKGTYTLKTSLQLFSDILDSGDKSSAEPFLKLLRDTFSQDLKYNQSLHFSYLLPRAVKSFPPDRRPWLIPVLSRVLTTDFSLAEPFLEGLEKGLFLLSESSLNRFVSVGLKKNKHSRNMAAQFLSLNSRLGLDFFHLLQVTVPFSQVRRPINRYLQARTGMPLSIQPLSGLSDKNKIAGKDLYVCSDGKFLYLPDQIGRFPTKEENFKLYKLLARLEAGLYEFSTFDFDLERLFFLYRLPMENFEADRDRHGLSDIEQFCLAFPLRLLAEDLFTLYEHGRIRVLMAKKYPGIDRRALPLLKAEMECIAGEIGSNFPSYPVFDLYARIGVGFSPDPYQDNLTSLESTGIDLLVRNFCLAMEKAPTVETSARLVFFAYPVMEELLKKRYHLWNRGRSFDYNRVKTPFNRRLRPDLYRKTFKFFEDIAADLKIKLEKQGLKAYKSDIRKRLIKTGGRMSEEDFKNSLWLSEIRNDDPDIEAATPDLSGIDLSGILANAEQTDAEAGSSVFWYPEWNCHLNDYVYDHVRVLDRLVPEQQGDFYQKTLENHSGLVSRIRYAFELLRPRGLKILRPWREGDDFDYRAMLDFAVDKKAGWLPSDKLYVKRLKQEPNVAVLLLVDLSRSTRNLILESAQCVLDVEKEAIVLFCEALEVLGDSAAIAGFSGTGRLGVDYFRIRDFGDPLSRQVKMRINAMTPQRSTRMGAAIRHGVTQLENVEARVRLMILLGDGFPNDLDYKQGYAIQDTRKAVSEALARNIAFRAVTVNITGDPRLDELYGDVHHIVISDVRELPDKLLRVYSALTRY